MSMLEGRKAYTPLEDNVKYKAILRNYIEVPNTSEDKKNEGYVQFIFELEDGRNITHNCTFPVGTDILARQLMLQQGLPNATEQLTVFNSAIQTNHAFDMWVTHRELNNQTYTNYTFNQPVVRPAATEQLDKEDVFN